MKYVCRVFHVTHQYDIVLIQTGFNRFTVEYGKDVKPNLSYPNACKALGQAIMHALSCSGEVDNRTREEAKEAGDSMPVFN